MQSKQTHSEKFMVIVSNLRLEAAINDQKEFCKYADGIMPLELVLNNFVKRNWINKETHIDIGLFEEWLESLGYHKHPMYKVGA